MSGRGQSECCLPVDGKQPQICPVKPEPDTGSPYQLLSKAGREKIDRQTGRWMDGPGEAKELLLGTVALQIEQPRAVRAPDSV